jgi:hypothetical protein
MEMMAATFAMREIAYQQRRRQQRRISRICSNFGKKSGSATINEFDDASHWKK